MKLTRLLKVGMSGEDVKYVQTILKSQGYFKGEPLGNFGTLTKEAVVWFQMSHIGKSGQPLGVDGEVGDMTWWSLHNPSGKTQKSGIQPLLPTDLTPLRLNIVTIAEGEHAIGVHEVPDGSNWGDGVTKYGGQPGWAWCCLFVCWVWKQATGSYPFGRLQPSTYQAWQYAKAQNWFKPVNAVVYPGDMFLMQYKNPDGSYAGKGHIGYVLRVGKTGFNTLEGNCGNRVKCGYRTFSQSSLVGFINPYPAPENKIDGWEFGTLRADDVSKAGTV